MMTVEKILEALFRLTRTVAGQFGGTVRFSSGDAYCLTFTDAHLAMTAAERLSVSWEDFAFRERLSSAVNAAVHHGLFYAFRSYLYGPGIDVAVSVEDAAKDVLAPNEGAIFVSGEMRAELAGTVWATRLTPDCDSAAATHRDRGVSPRERRGGCSFVKPEHGGRRSSAPNKRMQRTRPRR
jgi:class 3 adenylate cyclase